MDQAYKNAMQLRASLTDEQDLLKQHLNDVRQKLSEVERFLSEWRKYAGVEDAPAADDAPPVVQAEEPQAVKVEPEVVAVPRSRPKNPDKGLIGDKVEEMLTAFGKPAQRDYIFNELEQQGIVLNGTDPKMVLSTMLWRMKDRFKRIPGRGYWFADQPLPGDTALNEHTAEAAE